MPFKNRWRIDGTLTTQSPLHIGSGEVTTRKALVTETQVNGKVKKACIEISAVVTDVERRAYIPGKTIKGVLRAWLDERRIDAALIEQVFGSIETGESVDAFGGKAEFGDAFAVPPEILPRVPYPCDQRLTGVVVSVAIKRQTHTAYPKKLFHKEVVPPGITFNVSITGQNLEPEELQLLLYILDQFNHDDQPVVIGADTGNGFGRLQWRIRELSRLDQDDIDYWLKCPEAPVGYAGYPPLPDTTYQDLLAKARQAFRPVLPASLTLALSIHIDGPFLVNDPSQYTSKDDANHNPLRDPLGRAMLPASSIRGAFRSQAERIVRTLNPEAVCDATDPPRACNPIYEADKRHSALCLICQLFGAPGWSARVAFSDFVMHQEVSEIPFPQEFLAIDRFTGGGADGLKFNAKGVYQPVMEGTIAVHLDQFDEPWALGLLVLILRDLIEGDITLGFGAAKGYGACRARITGFDVHGLDTLPTIWALFGECEVTSMDWKSLDISVAPPEEVQILLMELVKAFQQQLRSSVQASAGAGHEIL